MSSDSPDSLPPLLAAPVNVGASRRDVDTPRAPRAGHAVFVLSVPGCSHRLLTIRDHLDRLGLPHEVLWAHDAHAPAGMAGVPALPEVARGIAGCWYSHLRAAAEVVRRGLEWALVLEDDARLTVSGPEVLSLVARLPAGWDCALLHRAHWWPAKGDGNTPWESVSELTCGTYTILWSQAGARRFLREGSIITGHVDGWLTNSTPGWKKYQHFPGVGLHVDGGRVTRDPLSGRWRIPRVIHQIWTGEKPVPEREQRWHRQWAAINGPLGWRAHLWTERTLEAEFPALWRRWRHLPPSPLSDVFRAAILHTRGGVYADTDMEPLMPVEALVEDASFFYGYEQPGIPGTACLASAPGHGIAERYLEEVVAGAAQGGGNWGSLTGPGALSRALATRPEPPGEPRWHWGVDIGTTTGSGVRAFKPAVFYPFYLGEPVRYLPGTFAAHHWAFSWKNCL